LPVSSSYLEEQKPTWLLNGTLTLLLQEISKMASRRLEQMVPRMTKPANVTDDLKAHAPMNWTQQMNNLKAQAEEILLTELIHN